MRDRVRERGIYFCTLMFVICMGLISFNRYAVVSADDSNGVRVIDSPSMTNSVNKNEVKELVIKGEHKTIYDWEFNSYTNLKKVTIESGVENIGGMAFSECPALEEVIIPDSVSNIKDFVFWKSDNCKISCGYESFAQDFAIKNNIGIKQMFNIPFISNLNITTNMLLNERKHISSKTGKIKIVLDNIAASGGLEYTEEMQQTFSIVNPVVNITLPAGMTFTDGSNNRIINADTIRVGGEYITEQDVNVNNVDTGNNPLEVVVRVTSDNQQDISSSKKMVSYGTEESLNSKKRIVKVKNKKFKVKSTYSNTIDCAYGTLDKISEYKVGNTYYILCVESEKSQWNVNVIKLDKKYKKKGKLTLKGIKSFPDIGGGFVGKDGNYYIACGKNNKKGNNHTTAKVMCIAKYNKKGKLIKKTVFKGGGIPDLDGYEVKDPFEFGDCVLTEDSKGRLFCMFGIIMYNGHQRCHVLSVDTKSMKKLDYEFPYCSHSLGQKIYALDNNEILYISKGDSYPRAIQISKLGLDNSLKNTFESFHFGETSVYQNTICNLGGMAEMEKGYMISASAEKVLNYQTQNSDITREKNVFLQLIDKDFSTERKVKNRLLYNTPVRYAQGIFEDKNVSNGEKDYGIIWLTNYKNNEHVDKVKIVRLSTTKAAILWEKLGKNDKVLGTYYCVVDQDGNVIKGETEIKGAQLSSFSQLVYDGTYILWTSAAGNNKISFNKLKVGKY